MGSSEKFCLRWNDFEANISSTLHDMKEEKDFTDVTLVCADQQVEAHRVILAACSPFFKKVLRKVQHSHPLIYMKGVKFSDLESVLSFVYHGEVNLAEEDLNSFLALGEELEVKGLRTENNSNQQPKGQLQHPSNHEFPSNSNDQHQFKLSPFTHFPAQLSLQTPLQAKEEWPSSENDNVDRIVNMKEPYSSQLMNTFHAPVEEVDQYAGYEDFSQERGDDFDLSNHIEKISEGTNFGKFKCNICGHMGSQKINVQRHVESKHFPGLFEYSCDKCEEKFNTRRKYDHHRSSHHPM